MEERILLAHGSGGKLSHDLVERNVLSLLGNPILCRLDDSATFELDSGGRLAFTTDSYVIDPIFFPGGDIGRLAVCGTVNDLCMMGAVPQYLSLSLIVVEGFAFGELERVMVSVRDAAAEALVKVIAGDTKVVERGNSNKLFINTSGIGLIREGIDVSGSNAAVGDKVILSGLLGDHGIAVLNEREGLGFESSLRTDCAPLNGLVADMFEVTKDIHCLRDPTRGGLATTLNEIAARSKVGIEIEEGSIPVRENVRAACEFLGLDPLCVANEGKLVATVAPDQAEAVLAKMRQNRYGRESSIIGEVVADHREYVRMRTLLGASRMIHMPAGELLPRIC